jgi:hypothetical protein
MDFHNHQETPPTTNLTVKIQRSARDMIIAKLIIFLSASILCSYWLTQDCSKRYEKGRTLTQETYLADFVEYKGYLLRSKENGDPVSTTLVSLIFMAFLVGSYEVASLIVSFAVGKIMKR